MEEEKRSFFATVLMLLKVLYVIVVIAYSLMIYTVIGYLGLEHHLGFVWATVIAITLLLICRALPSIVGIVCIAGAYLGIVDILEWHWAIAILLSMPALLFMIPSIVAATIGTLISKFKK